jgi:hypothetical protein
MPFSPWHACMGVLKIGVIVLDSCLIGYQGLTPKRWIVWLDDANGCWEGAGVITLFMPALAKVLN